MRTRQTKIPTSSELAQHVRDLCKAFNVKLLELPGYPYEEAAAAQLAFFDEKTGVQTKESIDLVVCAPVGDESTYAVAMHELGHTLHPTGRLQEFNKPKNWMLVLVEEESAWEWAEVNGLDWSPTMCQVRDWALVEYRKLHHKILEDKELRARAEFRRTHLPPPKRYKSMKDFLEDKPK